MESWYDHGVPSRYEDKPAITKWDPRTGRKVAETYKLRGRVSRLTDNPSHIEYDPETQNVTLEVYSNSNGISRAQGPARIVYDPKTGQQMKAEYFVDGVQVDMRVADAPKPSA